MKTHAPRLAILTFFTALTVFGFGRLARAGSNSGFFVDALGMAGTSSKGERFYQELVDQVYDEFRKMRAPFIVLNYGERPASEFQSDFATYCMDRDSSDVVSWLTSGDSSRKISFSCTLDSDVSHLRERLFVFTIRGGKFVDIQVASADIANVVKFENSNLGHHSAPSAKSWEPTNQADRVFMAVSGAMVSGGVTASTVDGVFQPKDLTSREAVSSAMVSGLGAAVSHFVFNLSPASSGLAGGGLSIALEDLNDGIPDPITGVPRRRVARQIFDNGGLGPISIRISFKFW